MFSRDRLVRKALRERFVVTLSAGEGVFSALLVAADPRMFVFADVRNVVAGGQEEPAPGHLYVDRTRVIYLQRI